MSVIQIRDFPDDLHYRMRLAAAKSPEPQRALIIRAIEREVARIEQEEPDR
jgi:plasmid stability protein